MTGTDTARSALAPPTVADAELQGLPRAHRISEPLHRLSEHREPWWFASASVDSPATIGGRFDLPVPAGTCYLAETLDGALCEKLLRSSKRVVPSERLASLFHATIDVRQMPEAVDLGAEAATAVGLNAEIHVGLAYRVSRAWARAFHRAGWQAISYVLRGDAALHARGLALFGRSGLRRRAPTGMRTTVRPLHTSTAAALLAGRGVRIIPMAVTPPTVQPPGHQG